MSQQAPPEAPPDTTDLGPLAWVHEELRKTLDASARCLQRYRREAEAAGAGFHAAGLPHQLQAEQFAHQCAGALHLVGQPACAAIADAMQAAILRFAEQRQPCTDEAVAQIEQAGLALGDYLQAVLAGQPATPTELFAPYRSVQALAGVERVHPAELWQAPASASAAILAEDAAPLQHSPALRGRMDQAVLKLVKSADPAAAQALQGIALGLAAGAQHAEQRRFWHLAAGYFEAAALGLVPVDLYSKRIASGVLTQYAALARGEAVPTNATLARELLFYCAHAAPAPGTAAPTLAAVRAAHGLQASPAPRYAQPRFGRFAPAQVAQVRRRLATATEAWTALAGGDALQRKNAHDQLLHVAEAFGALHADSSALMQALVQAADAAWHAGGMPTAPLVQEVTVVLLYLETACADLDRASPALGQHAQELAQRLAHAQQGGEPEPLPDWLAQLYQAVGDGPAMARVGAELGQALADIERVLAQFVHAPREKAVLGQALAGLAQVRGVLSALGLDEAALGAEQLHRTVGGDLVHGTHEADAHHQRVARIASSLAALGALARMLGHQSQRARQMFVYDAAQGLLRPRAGWTPDTPSPPADHPAQHSADEAGSDATPAPLHAQVQQGDDQPSSAAHPGATATNDAPAQAIAPAQIAPPLHHAYLHHADEWSRQLQAELGAWAQQPAVAPPASSAALALALADGSVGVGFDTLADLARLLAQALEQLRDQPSAGPSAAQQVLDAAEEIRRLLHQFAAGFLKPPRTGVVQALQALLPNASPTA